MSVAAWLLLRPLVNWLLVRMPVGDTHVPPNLMTVIICMIFAMLVIMAVVTTMMTGPLLRLLRPRVGHTIPAGIEA